MIFAPFTTPWPGRKPDSGPDDSDFFRLNAPVGPGQPNRREDVIKVETALGNAGHLDLARGLPGLLNTRPARLSLPKPPRAFDIDEQSAAFNQDTARATTRSSDDGLIPDIYARHLKVAGPAAHPALFDMAARIEEASGRDRVDRILHALLDKAGPDQARALLDQDPPRPRPLGVRLADLPDDDRLPLFRAAAEETPKPEDKPKPPVADKPIPPPPPPRPDTPEGGGKAGGEDEPPPDDEKCVELRATLERGRANLEKLQEEWKEADSAYNQSLTAEEAAWDAFISSATQAAIGAGSDCIAGLRQPVRAGGRAGIGLRVINCLRNAVTGSAGGIESVIDAFEQWRDARADPEESLNEREKKLSELDEQRAAVADLERQIQECGC